MNIFDFFFRNCESENNENDENLRQQKGPIDFEAQILQVVLPFVSRTDIKINKKKINLCSPLTNSVPVKSSEKVDEHF